MEVDAALAAKPVTIFGESFAPPERVLAALADVYGLRVTSDKDKGTLRLTRRGYREVAKPADLPVSLRAAFPEPLVRAFLVEIANPVDPAKRTDASTESQEESMAWNRTRLRPGEVRIAAMRRLRAWVEPLVKAAPDGRAPLSAVGDGPRSALANLLMADAWAALGPLIQHPVPDWIVRFDQVYLVGGLYEDAGEQRFSLFITTPTADGQRLNWTGPGVSNVYFGPASR
jgi:hypothetical protein